jgi:hypothetical protein
MKLASFLDPQRLNAADLSDLAFDLIVSLGIPGGGVGAVGGTTRGSARLYWLHEMESGRQPSLRNSTASSGASPTKSFFWE